MKRFGIVDYYIPPIEKASSANYLKFAVRINSKYSDQCVFQVK